MRGYMVLQNTPCRLGTLLFGYEWPPVPVESGASALQPRMIVPLPDTDLAPDPAQP